MCVKIYIDVVLFINFSFDLLILLTTSILLKRNALFSKVLMGAFVGSLSILFLFFNVSSLVLFVFKVLISVFMVLISFGFKNFKYFFKNMLFLYTVSIVLGGFLYYLSCVFSYKNTGLVFYFKGLSINYIFLFISSPVILFIYVKETRSFKRLYNNIFRVCLVIGDKRYFLNGFMDSGNNLVDPYFCKPIILINKEIVFDRFIMVPYVTASSSSVLKCVSGKVFYKDLVFDVYVGNCFNIDIEGVDCLLNNKMEGIC